MTDASDPAYDARTDGDGELRFERLETRQFVRLRGVPFADGPSDWHVNDHIQISTGSGALTALLERFSTTIDVQGVTDGIVLQRADATPEWLGIVLDSGLLRHSFRFDAQTEPQLIDGSLIEIEAIAAHPEALDDD